MSTFLSTAHVLTAVSVAPKVTQHAMPMAPKMTAQPIVMAMPSPERDSPRPTMHPWVHELVRDGSWSRQGAAKSRYATLR